MFGNLFSSQDQTTQDVQQIQTPASPPVVNQPVQTPPPSPEPPQGNPAPPLQPMKQEDMSALSHLDPRSSQILTIAQEEAGKMKQPTISPENLLLGLLYDTDIFHELQEFSVEVSKLVRELQSQEKEGTFVGQPQLADATKQIIEDAYNLSKKRGSQAIAPEDILLAFLSANISVSTMLTTQGLEKDKVAEKLADLGKYSLDKKSLLAQYGIDLTSLAEKGQLDPTGQRDNEIERIIHILLRRIKNNPIIIGEAGVGKTAVVEGLAQLIAAGKVPDEMKGKRIIQVDIASLLAGASHRGEFEERLRNLIREAQISEGKVILFIDEIHTLIGAGDTQGSLDASNILKPFLARGQIQLIGSTTTSEYRHYIEKDKAFERRFQTVLVEEPSIEQATAMLQLLKPKYEAFHHVTFSQDALDAAVTLSKRYIGDRYLPDKAVDILDEAAAEVRLSYAAKKRQDNTISRQDVETVISKWTGIPLTKLTENESEKLLHLEDLIHKRLINQETAVNAIAEAVRRGRIGLANSNRPIASFIFLGPTGVGKTELAKTLAEILFGKEEAMIRLDMSEYMEKHEVAKLIGAPPGYVGYEEGGQLTEAVRLKPYSVVLFDEVEKAHPDVFNKLLQLLEDGRLTDNKGNTISFKNTIIILTSNIGSSLIQQQLQQVQANTQKDQIIRQLRQVVTDELHKFFKPELLNRVDEVIIFEPLGKNHMADIAKLQIALTRKLLIEQTINLTITDGALLELAKDGYDPVYGARPLRRLIQTAIENPIAKLLIEKKFLPGDTIQIDYDQAQRKYTFSIGLSRNTKQVQQTTPAPEQVLQPANPVPQQTPSPVNPQPLPAQQNGKT